MRQREKGTESKQREENEKLEGRKEREGNKALENVEIGVAVGLKREGEKGGGEEKNGTKKTRHLYHAADTD